MIDPGFALGVISWLSPLLFGVGVAGVFARRSSLAMMTSLQLMVSAGVLALVGFDLRHALAAAGAGATGQGFGVSAVILLAAQTVVTASLLIARARTAARKGGPVPW
ncbi:MAG: hypothetical protein QF570_09285 [Myxococcota bacterium]|jgi:NADH:ubiquinone oxidoreductase subunit K|nr:hypothetical protein [Myxococcota bacterium]